jgi:hypothetical protein
MAQSCRKDASRTLVAADIFLITLLVDGASDAQEGGGHTVPSVSERVMIPSLNWQKKKMM